jgi:hypothetical protein
MAANPSEIMNTDDDQDESQDDDIEEMDDGSAVVTLHDEKEQEQQVAETEDFYQNLAGGYQLHILETLASDLLKKIENDKESRKKRIKEYEDALKRTGLTKEEPGGANFTGASTVVHPILIEATIDYASRAVAELIPPEGPVRVYTPGEVTKARAEKAKRKAAHMNWQFKTQMKSFKPELEQLLPQEALAGGAYMRLVYDSFRKKPIPTFIPMDNIFLPYAASNLYTAERVTWAEDIVQSEFEKRINEGMYIEIIDTTAPSQAPEKSKAEEQNDKIEGKTPDTTNEDGVRRVFLTQACVEIEDEKNPEKKFAPYLISIDETSRKVVSLVRNWEEDDEQFETMQWIVEWPFIPWRGAYPIGLNQVMAGIPAAVTGALRAVLDSAHINNLPTLIRLKGSNTTGQSEELNITQVTEIQGGVSGDDIRKLIMAVPYNQPSTVLVQLLGLMVEAGKGIVRTTFENLADQNPDMPAMLGLALIEQGMKVMSAIHLRQWTAMDNVISVLHRINRLYITDEEILDETGVRLAFRSDYEGPLDCVPTADPQVFSDAQRFAQINVVAQRSQNNPLYDQRKVEEMILERTKIPNAKDLLIPKLDPKPMNAVNENLALALGRPVAAFPEQDHLGHIQTLLDFMQSPLWGFSHLFAAIFLPPALEHLKQHLGYWYVNEFYEEVSKEAGMDVGDMMKDADPELRTELDKTLAAASSKHVIPISQSLFGKIPQIVEQAYAMIQKYTPPPPADPTGSIAAANIQAGVKREAIQAETADTDKKIAAEQQTNQTELAVEKMREANKAQQAQQGEDADSARAELQAATKEKVNKEDNLTALTIAGAENEEGRRSHLSTGTGINPE